MKFLSTLVLSVAALASAAAIDPANSLVQRNDAAAEITGNLETLAFQLSDGSRKVEFVLEGSYEGSIVQAADGTVQAYGADGKELELDDIVAENEDGGIQKRNPAAIIRILGAVIKKYGPRAMAFFNCVGFTTSAKCGQSFIDCATRGQAPWACPGGLICAGGAAKQCF